MNNNKQEINVIDTDNKKCFHNITDIGLIMHLQFEGKFLYVLAQDSKGNKLLRYDSNNWHSSPKELFLPEGKVSKFCLGENEFLFSIFGDNEKYQFFAIKKKDCFSSNKISFMTMSSHSEEPRLKVIQGKFFTITSAYSSTSSKPSSVLSELCLKDSIIVSRPLQSLSMDSSKIMDFHVQLDRIFILSPYVIKATIDCYNLADGTLVKSFSPNSHICFGSTLTPQLVTPAPDRIQLIFSTSREVTEGQYSLANVLMNLDYKA